MNINEIQRHACAAVSVACSKSYPAVRLDNAGQAIAEAFLMGEFGGLTAASICANPHYAAMFLEKTLGISDPYAMADDFDNRIKAARLSS